MLTRLNSQNLAHVIGNTFTPTNHWLNEAQTKWFYSVLLHKCTTASAKTIVTAHRADKNTRVIWEELCEKYDYSMSLLLHSQKLSNYICTARYHYQNWKGTMSMQCNPKIY